jgi:hypothetical protein
MTHPRDTGSAHHQRGRDESYERAVTLLGQRFPNIPSVSLKLLGRQETFRDLCDEYAVCSEMLERLQLTESSDAIRKEFSALQLRLEGELLRYISKHGSA